MAVNFSANIVSTIARAGQTCDIEKPIQSTGSLGQTLRTFVSHKKNVACWVQEKGSSSLTQDGKIFLDTSVICYFATDPEIVEGYKILFNSDTYLVDGISNQGGVGQLFKARLELKK